MRNSPLESNRAYALLSTAWHIVKSAFSSVSLILRSLSGKAEKPLPPNRFFEALHFLFVSGPRHYWKRPTAISAGRSVSTFLHFVLERDRRFVEKTNGKGFTLIELMVSISVVSLILVMGFQAFAQISAFRTNVNDRIDLWQDLYYNIERLVGIVKEGGIIDYEEYWNRAAVGTGITNGHYSLPTGFGNYGNGGSVGIGGSFGSGTYLCASPSGAFMGTGGCLVSSNENATNMSGPQRYGQYALQYFDANANMDDDGGDEDDDGKITGDEDDEDLGAGPAAFPYGAALRELYLIKKGGVAPERLILRWNVIPDPDAPMGFGCSVSTDGIATGSGCLWRLEMLRLTGRDYGFSHALWAPASPERFDGKIDTWECRNDFFCAGSQNTPIGTGSSVDSGISEWVSVFPNDINVSDVSFSPYPNKDYRLAWKENDPSVRIAPYVRVNLTLGFSWNRRKRLNNGSNPQAHVTTSVSLSE